jgi:hypothetical protein
MNRLLIALINGQLILIYFQKMISLVSIQSKADRRPRFLNFQSPARCWLIHIDPFCPSSQWYKLITKEEEEAGQCATE